MKRRLDQSAVFLLFMVQFQLIFCIHRKQVSIELVHNNQILYNCRSAEIIKLENSGHSGFQFHCGRSSASTLNRITGEPPFPEDFRGNIIPGTNRFEMSEPCGTLFIRISESKQV